MKKFYLTTAIAYASQKPHIGNTYEIVLADSVARFKRLCGYDVTFVTGTDEHGQKVEDLAKKAGVTPQEYVDRISGEIKRIWDKMNSSYTRFIRTTEKQHTDVVQKLFNLLYQKGDIYKGAYEGMYCVPCESFFTDSQLKDGKCPECGREVNPTKEEAYFFKMSRYQDRLLDYIEKHPEWIQPKSREREMVNNFLKPGLQDLCVSRTSFDWGVKVDFDPKHIVYVWLDALVNYITAIGYSPDKSEEGFSQIWPADLQIIGKDILRFHTIYWPILLMALDLPLPKKIFGHPWILSGDSKMSKSVGNVIYADELSDLFSVDAVRFYLLSEMPYAQDGSITYENFIHIYNTELANTLGNLVNRTVSMTEKYFDAVIPAIGEEDPLDENLRRECAACFSSYMEQMESLHIADAVSSVLNFARRCNKYIDETMPWILGKDPEKKPRLQTVLYNLLESIRQIAQMLLPIIPESSQTILEQIGADKEDVFPDFKFGLLQPGRNVGPAKALFSRIDEKSKLAEIEEKLKKPSAKAKEDTAPTIGIEDFAKVSLCAAQILECEKIEKSKKLLRLQIDDGEGTRQVVSGISPYYKPEELIGKKVILVKNLKEAKLCGEKSAGMILAADKEGGVEVVFLDNSIPNGAVIR